MLRENALKLRSNPRILCLGEAPGGFAKALSQVYKDSCIWAQSLFSCDSKLSFDLLNKLCPNINTMYGAVPA